MKGIANFAWDRQYKDKHTGKASYQPTNIPIISRKVICIRKLANSEEY